MSYVLFHKLTSTKIKLYATEKGARIGMRASNKNAGWHRFAVCWGHLGVVSEWSCKDDNYDYAPYAIVHQTRFDALMKHRYLVNMQ